VRTSNYAVLSEDRPSAAPRECFADEIAIDFPASDHFVERARRTFAGEQAAGAIVTAVVRLSRVAARTGAVVPLEVPVRIICRACGGRGEVWADPCEACAGTGDALQRHVVNLTVPAGVVDGARFFFRVVSTHEPTRVEIRVSIPEAAPGG
jgi:hypothetical protein